MLRKVFNLAGDIARRKPFQKNSSFSLEKVLPAASHGFNRYIHADAKERQIKIIKTELIHLSEEGVTVPEIENISKQEWDELLLMKPGRRREFYSVLFRKHCAKENDTIRKEIRREQAEVRKQEWSERNAANKHIVYGIGRNTLFMRIYPQTLSRWRHLKIWRSFVHDNSHLILDCSFENEMSTLELKSLVKQIALSHSVNRFHPMPFFFNLTGLRPNGRLHKMLLTQIPTLHSASFPAHVTDKFIPDHIAPERIVYLTPNSSNLLTEFNHNDVYIIGALVDKGEKKPLTLAKSKELGLRSARLPIDKFVEWRRSDKTLTIDQMTKIMLEFKRSNDMRLALLHVPTRKRNS